MPINISEIIAQEDIPAISTDEEGMVTAINKAFEKVYGWGQETLLGKPLYIIIPDELRTAHDIGFSRFLKTEHPTLMGKPLTLSVCHASGAFLSAEHTIYAEKQEGKWVFAALMDLLES